MKPISQYISAMLATLMSVALCGCGSSDPEPPSTESEMSISFRVETRNEGETNAGEEGSESSTGNGDSQIGYEGASTWENYIDIENNDYRIAFFDYNNRCITPFTPTSIDADDKGTYIDYTLTGEVPAILRLYPDFKIVVLANWGPTNYPEIKSGITTMDALCCPSDPNLGKFAHFESNDYQIAEGQRYLPMYGIKEYRGVTFELDDENNTTVKYEGGDFGPVNMLRAVAKVELDFDTEVEIHLDPEREIYITNYNSSGYCAPEGVYMESDYYNKNWNKDYWKDHLHLVGGQNDQGDDKPLTMKKLTKDGKDIWIAYLPEYRNIALTGNNSDCNNSGIDASSAAALSKARIAVPHIQRGLSKTSYIEFADYDEAGEPGNPINIERNNLYRFTIIAVDEGVKWEVEAEPWNGYEHETIVM